VARLEEDRGHVRRPDLVIARPGEGGDGERGTGAGARAAQGCAGSRSVLVVSSKNSTDPVGVSVLLVSVTVAVKVTT